jgi:hypothetical protein
MGGLVSGFVVLNFGKLFYTQREESRSTKSKMEWTKKEKMPGFPTETVGTPTNRGKARRYTGVDPFPQRLKPDFIS